MLKLALRATALASVPLILGVSPAALLTPAQAAPAFQPTRFSVVVEGSGPDVILIPGLASPRAVWDGALAALGGKYRLHLVQLNGFGGSAAGANREGHILPATIDELSRYIAANRLDHPAIVGHSMGGFIGLSLASAHPDQVGKLMIVDSLPFIGLLMGPDTSIETLKPQAAAMRDMIASGKMPSGAAPGMSRTAEGQAKVAA